MRVKVVRLSALVVMLGIPLAAACTGAERLVPFLAMPFVVLGTPMIASLFGDPRSLHRDEPEGGEDSDDGPGGNKRPDPQPLTPRGPRGTLPLESSSPARWRLRGGERVRVSDPGPRRAPHRPAPRRTPGRPQPLRTR